MIPEIRKITTPQVKNAVLAEASKDNHPNFHATHVIMKNDEIAGAYNVCETPMVLVWHHSEKLKARDSLLLNSTGEAIMSQLGINSYYIACDKESPFHSHMTKFGFKPVWSTDMFIKNLKNY
tara:strand:+ start:131 stop:496 length:366 start_codon:yes stop_codon:yes gene_type:complete